MRFAKTSSRLAEPLPEFLSTARGPGSAIRSLGMKALRRSFATYPTRAFTDQLEPDVLARIRASLHYGAPGRWRRD